MRYRTIVADPPWDVGRPIGWGQNVRGGKLPYPTMDIEDIAAMPVVDLAARQAHLYLWTINSYIEDAYDIARAWGFRPARLLTWVKKPMGLGPGGTFASCTEFVLFAHRGGHAQRREWRVPGSTGRARSRTRASRTRSWRWWSR